MPNIGSLAGWQPRALPSPQLLEGRYVTLVPLSAERHAADLWRGVEGHDEVWDYLSNGPYATEADFRSALEVKQNGTAAVFRAGGPGGSGGAGGDASGGRGDAPN